MGLATAAFLLTKHWLIELIWEEIPHQLGKFRFYTTVAMLQKPLAVELLVVLLMPASLIAPIIVGAYVGTAFTLPIPGK